MKTHAEAQLLALQLDDETRWRRPGPRSRQSPYDLAGFDKPEIGRDPSPPYDHRGVVVVASAWLAFYLLAAIHHFVS
jgi:hypothetical protein